MAQYMMANGKLDARTVRASSHGQTSLASMDSLFRMTFMERASTNGVMGAFTKAAGAKTRCMAMASSSGQMGDPLRVLMLKTRCMVLAHFLGLMEGSMWVSGRTEDNMGPASILLQRVKVPAVNGLKVEK